MKDIFPLFRINYINILCYDQKRLIYKTYYSTFYTPVFILTADIYLDNSATTLRHNDCKFLSLIKRMFSCSRRSKQKIQPKRPSTTAEISSAISITNKACETPPSTLHLNIPGSDKNSCLCGVNYLIYANI